MTRIRTGLAVLALLGATGTQTAAAQSPTTRGYDGDAAVLGDVASAPAREGSASAATSSAPRAMAAAPAEGELPFTGGEAAIVAAAGGALLLAGVGLRRAGARQPV